MLVFVRNLEHSPFPKNPLSFQDKAKDLSGTKNTDQLQHFFCDDSYGQRKFAGKFDDFFQVDGSCCQNIKEKFFQ